MTLVAYACSVTFRAPMAAPAVSVAVVVPAPVPVYHCTVAASAPVTVSAPAFVAVHNYVAAAFSLYVAMENTESIGVRCPLWCP